jgi:hypothetical protein
MRSYGSDVTAGKAVRESISLSRVCQLRTSALLKIKNTSLRADGKSGNCGFLCINSSHLTTHVAEPRLDGIGIRQLLFAWESYVTLFRDVISFL